jgi:RNA polymerase-binding transcription factor DksA
MPGARTKREVLTSTPIKLQSSPFLTMSEMACMADDIDIANDLNLTDMEVSLALSRLRKQAGIGQEGSRICMECGDDIPKDRKELGFKFCVPCAQDMERRRQLYADD